MGEAGRPYPKFQRALKSRDLRLIEPLALEVGRVDLADALTIVSLYAEQRPERFERACLKWLARFATERAASTEDVGFASDALARLPEAPEEALSILRSLL